MASADHDQVDTHDIQQLQHQLLRGVGNDNEPMTETNTAINTAGNSPARPSIPLPRQQAEESPRNPSEETSHLGQELTTPLELSSNSQTPPLTTSVATPAPTPTPAPPEMPQTQLTFLLVSGKRRTMSFDPDTTIGRVKELVWNAWPSDWQSECPPAPSYLKVLYLGKILQDEDTLASHKLRPTPAPPTIVHLSVRQVPIPSDSADAIKKKKRRNANSTATGNGGNGSDEGGDEGACCGCVIC